MKKIIMLSLIAIFVVSCTVQKSEEPTVPSEDTNAEEKSPVVNNTAPEALPKTEEPPVEEPKITLAYTIEDGKPVLSWNIYNDSFRNYVVLKSIVTDTPDYPGEYSIKTLWKADQTTYTDPYPDGGISYYRVVQVNALTHATKSNMVMVELPDQKETPDQELNLIAEKNGNGVKLSWDEYKGAFRQYIVVSTTKHPYPKYPDDIIEKTIPFVHETSYTVYPKPGVNYYAVTVIRPDKTKFTSNRVVVEG